MRNACNTIPGGTPGRDGYSPASERYCFRLFFQTRGQTTKPTTAMPKPTATHAPNSMIPGIRVPLDLLGSTPEASVVKRTGMAQKLSPS